MGLVGECVSLSVPNMTYFAQNRKFYFEENA